MQASDGARAFHLTHDIHRDQPIRVLLDGRVVVAPVSDLEVFLQQFGPLVYAGLTA